MIMESPQADAQCPNTRVVAFIVYARFAEDGDVPLTCYAGSKGEITTRVMDAARREGFKGTFQERMDGLGWYLVALTPAPMQIDDSAFAGMYEDVFPDGVRPSVCAAQQTSSSVSAPK